MKPSFYSVFTRKWHYLFVLLLPLFSCNPHRIVNHFQEIKGNAWDYQTPIEFDVKIEDSTKVYESKINLRYNSAYLYPYLGMIVAITSPDGKVEKREVIFYLKDENGKFKGEVAGDIWDFCCFTIIEPQHFQQGNYHFALYQVTAMPIVKDVMGLGLEIIEIPPKS